MTFSRTPVTIATFAWIAVSACSSDQSVDPGIGPNPASEGGADGNGVTLLVSYEARAVPVDLGSLATTVHKAANLVRLSDVWTSANIPSDRATLTFEFVGSDGFTPLSKGCADLPGSFLDQGYVDPWSRNLIWDEALGLQGCYAVRNAAQMNARAPTDAGLTPDAPPDAPIDGNGVTILVAYANQSVSVDLGTIATTRHDGSDMVRLSDVWTGANIPADRTTLAFEFVGSDGFRPSDRDCADLPGTALDQGYIDPITRDLAWDDALKLGGCYSVHHTSRMNARTPAAD